MEELRRRLQDFSKECDRVREELLQEFAEKDWEDEFAMMDEDEEYSIMPADWSSKFQDYEILDHAFKQILNFRDENFTNFYWRVREKSNALYKELFEILKTKYYELDEDLRPSYIKCEDCDAFSKTVQEGREHECRVDTATAQKRENCRHGCNKCKYYTNSQDCYDKHMKSKQHLKNMGIIKPTSFNCSKCDKQFRFNSDLQKHEPRCKDKEEHKCSKCDRQFTFRSELIRHENTCKEKQEYHCVKCDRHFTFQSDYKRHLNTLKHNKT